MKCKKKLLLFFLIFSKLLSRNCAVTYERNNGFFGDNLISYISACQLVLDLQTADPSAKIDFLYAPFPYSDVLKLNNFGKEYKAEDKSHYNTIIYYDKNNAQAYMPTPDTLYITTWVQRPQPNFRDSILRNLMKKTIAPQHQIQHIEIPKNCINVACHIRRGGGFAKKEEHMPSRKPLQFVPLHYYRDQIERLLELYPRQKIYIHIFTDDKNPEKIVAYLQESINSKWVEYGYRKEHNAHNKNVINDFFNMMDKRFNVLIRSRSNFSKLAAYLGDHEMYIIPESHSFADQRSDAWYIDKVLISVACKTAQKKKSMY